MSNLSDKFPEMVSDTIYGSGWDGVVNASPSKNAVYDKIETLSSVSSVNAQTGTTYTLVIGDANDIVTMNNASANTLTIPLNSSVAFGVGTIIAVDMIGVGTTTITGATGVTVNGTSAGSETITAQYLGVCLKMIAADTWLIQGGI